MHLLLIEDDAAVAGALQVMLKGEGCTLRHAANAMDGIAAAKQGGYDIILLDLGLPDMSGLDALKIMRAGKVHTPILVLSGDVAVESRVKALGLGADDYLTKPYHRDELVARLHALARRERETQRSVLSLGKLVVDMDAKTVAACGRKIDLTIKEYQIVELLSQRRGTALSKRALLTYLYNGMDEPRHKIVDVFVCKIRRKIAEATGGESFIRTVWGWGYQIDDEDAQQPIAA